ncbi:MAG: hypothetical protein AB8B67_05080 [Rickettsiaceae bacterium]
MLKLTLLKISNANSAKYFLSKALKSISECSHPSSVNTDKNPAMALLDKIIDINANLG